MESVELLHLVFSYLDARDLASCCCCSKLWKEVGSGDHLWRTLCLDKWPGCDRKQVGRKAIEAMGGFKVFYSRRERLRTSSLKPSNCCYSERTFAAPLSLDHLTFFVDLTYKGMPVISDAFPGTVMSMQESTTCSPDPAPTPNPAPQQQLVGCFGVRIDPNVVTDAVLPRQALTPFFYQGQLYYEQPFQALHASDYCLTWTAVRSTDHRMSCILHAAPDVLSTTYHYDDLLLQLLDDGRATSAPWDRNPSSASSCLPLLFQSELGGSGPPAAKFAVASRPTLFLRRSPFLSFACLDCRPMWGQSLSQPMHFKLLQFHLGIWQRNNQLVSRSRSLAAPHLDMVLCSIAQLDWIQ